MCVIIKHNMKGYEWKDGLTRRIILSKKSCNCRNLFSGTAMKSGYLQGNYPSGGSLLTHECVRAHYQYSELRLSTSRSVRPIITDIYST